MVDRNDMQTISLPASRKSSLIHFLAICLLLLVLPALAQAEEPKIQRTAHFAEILTGDAPHDVADLKSMESQIREVTKRAKAATVGVVVGPAQGSGVIVSRDGLILTAGHVIGAPGREVVIILNDGRRVRGKTLGTDRSIDSGAIQITTPGRYPHLPIRSSSNLNEGEWVLVMGHAGGIVKGREPALRLGRVLANADDVIATDATLVGGDSGGPLIDLQGNVIGVNSRIGNRITANLHVPSSEYLATIDRLKRSEVWGRLGGTQPFLGVRCESDRDNVVVSRVTPDSPAEKAGLEVGDEILSFNETPVGSFDDLKTLVNEYSPGDNVQLRVKRKSGKTVLLDLEIADRRNVK